MKRLFLVPLFILVFVAGVFAAPPVITQNLVCDDMLYISASEVTTDGTAQDGIWVLRADGLRDLLSVDSLAPGIHSFTARVYGRTSDDPTQIEQWSGDSNTVTGRKPTTPSNIRYSNGYIVCNPQPSTFAVHLYINDTEQSGLNEVVDGELRIYQITAPGRYEIHASLEDVSGWRGDWNLNPFVVTMGDVPLAPVIRGVKE